jgi:hypothetical protein
MSGLASRQHDSMRAGALLHLKGNLRMVILIRMKERDTYVMWGH